MNVSAIIDHMRRFPDVLLGKPASMTALCCRAALSGESYLVNWGPYCEWGALWLMGYKCHFKSFLIQGTMQDISLACIERQHCGHFNRKVSRNRNSVECAFGMRGVLILQMLILKCCVSTPRVYSWAAGGWQMLSELTFR